MSGGISATTVLSAISTAAGVFGAISQASAAKKSAAAQQPPAPVAPPQASKAPDPIAYQSANSQAAAASGPASTLLTGPAGVSSDSLLLGKNTLLGE